MAKIYIITNGEYSEYHIVRVFSTLKKAKEFVDIRGSEYVIEEWPLDEETDRKTSIWEVSLAIGNKEVVSAMPTKMSGYKDCIEYEKDEYGREVLSLFVESDSMKRAVKIASERYGAVIANEQSMYPLMRIRCSNYGFGSFPVYDFYTGDVVITDEEYKNYYPPFVRFKVVKHV